MEVESASLSTFENGQVVQIIPADSVVTLGSELAGSNIIFTEGEILPDGQIHVYSSVEEAEQGDTYPDRIRALEEKIATMESREIELGEEIQSLEAVNAKHVHQQERVSAMQSLIVDLLPRSSAISDDIIARLESVGIHRGVQMESHAGEVGTAQEELPAAAGADDQGDASGSKAADSGDEVNDGGDPLDANVGSDKSDRNGSGEIIASTFNTGAVGLTEGGGENDKAPASVVRDILEGPVAVRKRSARGTTPHDTAASEEIVEGNKCPHCDVTFKRSGNLRRHLLAKHPQQDPEDDADVARLGTPEKSNKAPANSIVTKSGRVCKRKRMFDYETDGYTKEEPSDGDDESAPVETKKPKPSPGAKRGGKKYVWVVCEDEDKSVVPGQPGESGAEAKAVDPVADAGNTGQGEDEAAPETLGSAPPLKAEPSYTECLACSKTCPEVFANYAELKEHRRAAHAEDARWHCQHCGHFYEDYNQRVAHKSECAAAPADIKETWFVCHICGKTKTSMAQLKSHVKTHQRSGKSATTTATRGKRRPGGSTMKVPCPVCQKEFKRVVLKRHMASHERPVPCELCGQGFPSQDSLATHKLRDHDDFSQARYKCDVCGMVFTNLYKCKTHMDVHKETRDVVCEFCHKTFPCERYLWTHRRVKHLEKTHACQLCDKKFGLKTQLKIHVDTVHLQIRKYRCKKCNIEFAEHAALSQHRNALHAGEVAFQCLICMKGFQRRYRYRSHLHQCHGVETSIQDDGQMVIHSQELENAGVSVSIQ